MSVIIFSLVLFVIPSFIDPFIIHSGTFFAHSLTHWLTDSPTDGLRERWGGGLAEAAMPLARCTHPCLPCPPVCGGGTGIASSFMDE
mmetsp:Transcript_27353/g.68281  ORF Transcript_27353/g.68281 Transcript_27353/m.68281 type:complete len:87 (+) Transcript_27353:918-1178(+)